MARGLVTETSSEWQSRRVAHLRVEGPEQLLLHVPSPVYSASPRFLGAGNSDGVGCALWGCLSQLLRASEMGWLGEQHFVLYSLTVKQVLG